MSFIFGRHALSQYTLCALWAHVKNVLKIISTWNLMVFSGGKFSFVNTTRIHIYTHKAKNLQLKLLFLFLLTLFTSEFDWRARALIVKPNHTILQTHINTHLLKYKLFCIFVFSLLFVYSSSSMLLCAAHIISNETN